MKEIPLNRGLITFVHDEDYEWLSKYKWTARESGKNFYALRPESRVGLNRTRKYFMMHREIIGAKQDEIVDHINRKTLDNRRCNLRIVTKQQSNWNRGPFTGKRASSKYKGVCWNTKRSKWKAGIYINGKAIILGFFENEKDASCVYDKKALELFGGYAYVNHPQ